MFAMFKQFFNMITIWFSTLESVGRSANNAALGLEAASVSLKAEQEFKQQLNQHDLQERILASQEKLDKARAHYEASKPRNKPSPAVSSTKPVVRKPRKPKAP
jgi:hypothetical protein